MNFQNCLSTSLKSKKNLPHSQIKTHGVEGEGSRAAQSRGEEFMRPLERLEERVHETEQTPDTPKPPPKPG